MTAALHLRGFGDYGFRNTSTVTNHTVDANNEGVAWAFNVDSTDPITHLGFRYGARTGTPPTYQILLEGLDSTGLPDGTDVGGGSPTAVTFTPPADTTINGLWQWKALTNAYTPAAGQFFAAVIRYSSGTIDGSNNSSFTQRVTGVLGASQAAFPYSLSNSAGTWSKSPSVGPVFGYRTANGRYGRIYQAMAFSATANTAGHKSGMFFTVPSGLCSTYKVAALAFAGDVGNTGGSCKIGIWNTSGTELQAVTIDSDHTSQTPSLDDSVGPIYFAGTLATLDAGTKYYCGIEVVSSAVGMSGITLAEAADRSAFPNGVNRGLVTYNGTTWTETDTTMPLCELILSDVTNAASGGGGQNAALVGGIYQ